MSEPIYTIQNLIKTIDKGDFAIEASAALERLIEKVQKEAAKGTLTIKLTVEPTEVSADCVKIGAEYSAAAPKHTSRKHTYRSVNNPDLLSLFDALDESSAPSSVELNAGSESVTLTDEDSKYFGPKAV